MGFETSLFRAQLNDFPYLKRWLDQLAARPAIIRAYEKGTAINTTPTVTEESRRFLFGPVPLV